MPRHGECGQREPAIAPAGCRGLVGKSASLAAGMDSLCQEMMPDPGTGPYSSALRYELGSVLIRIKTLPRIGSTCFAPRSQIMQENPSLIL